MPNVIPFASIRPPGTGKPSPRSPMRWPPFAACSGKEPFFKSLLIATYLKNYPRRSGTGCWTNSVKPPDSLQTAEVELSASLASSHLRAGSLICLRRELAEEAQVVLGEPADIGDLVLAHGQTLDAEAEGPAGVF